MSQFESQSSRFKTSHLWFSLFALGVVIAACGHSPDYSYNPPPNTRVEDGVQQVLDTATQKENVFLPGAIAHVRTTGYRPWTGAGGLGEIDSQRAMRPQDRIRAGSIVKTFLAAVVIQHVEEGDLSLEQKLTELLPDSVTDRVENAEQITLRMLLNHTSGIPEWVTEEVHVRVATDPSYVWTTDEALDISAAQSPSFPPGTGWKYSNTNYVLVGLILDGHGGSWRTQIRERVIERLGLASTRLPEPGDRSVGSDDAHGYFYVGGNVLDLSAVDPSMAGASGGNAMVTTVLDLGRFLEALLGGALFDKAETLTEMTTMVDAPDETGFPHKYGLGIESFELPGQPKIIGHAGGAPGYTTMMFYVPTRATTLVTSGNTGDLFTTALQVFVPALDVIDPKSEGT